MSKRTNTSSALLPPFRYRSMSCHALSLVPPSLFSVYIPTYLHPFFVSFDFYVYVCMYVCMYVYIPSLKRRRERGKKTKHCAFTLFLCLFVSRSMRERGAEKGEVSAVAASKRRIRRRKERIAELTILFKHTQTLTDEGRGGCVCR